MNSEILQLESALFFAEDEARDLGRLLLLAREGGTVTYSCVAGAIAEPEETLLAAWHWRMLIPSNSSSRSLAWESAVLRFDAGVRFNMPAAVRLIVDHAALTGFWEPHRALGEACPLLEGVPAKTVAELLRQMRFSSEEDIISAVVLGGIMKRLRLRGSLDQLIIELKAAGVVSPYLTSSLGTFSGTSPRYEINPCLLRGIV